MRTSEIFQETKIPNFEREILPVFEEQFAHLFSLNGDRMREALGKTYWFAAEYRRGNLSEEELDRGLADLVGEYPELGASGRQTKGFAYTAVVMKLVTGESLTDLE